MVFLYLVWISNLISIITTNQIVNNRTRIGKSFKIYKKTPLSHDFGVFFENYLANKSQYQNPKSNASEALVSQAVFEESSSFGFSYFL